MSNLPIALTMGEPAGIGGEITLNAWRLHRKNLPTFFVIDCAHRLSHLANKLGWTVPISPIRSPEEANDAFLYGLPVLDTPITAGDIGVLSRHTPKGVIASIEKAVALTMNGEACAVVTNPIHKENLIENGFNFPGHTEFLAALAHLTTPPVMMLASDEMRVVPLTVHCSLKNAIQQLTTEMIVEKCMITHAALQKFAHLDHPRLALSGLNPHAGENGIMGDEEQRIIVPAIEILKKNGIDAVGPLPADTMFHERARKNYDVAMCMYHDQALIPIKTIAFDHGVNVTLGLPFIRTSPDHGTALNIAGQGIANETSLCCALKMAKEMAKNNNKWAQDHG